MEPKQIAARVAQLLQAIESLLPEYLADPPDLQTAQGNVAVCIIDAQGNVYGKMFTGTNGDRLRQRECYRVAWTKASQVWLTGIKTFEYEKLVFTGQIDAAKFGIKHPDFIGWEGGQPISLDADTQLSVGFSGMRGTSDLAIVQRAMKLLPM
jgi:uncharacterized protein GlcG (DUF336 family)